MIIIIDFYRRFFALQASATTDQSILDGLPESTQMPTPAVEVGNRRKRRCFALTPTPPASPSPSSGSSSCASILHSAVAALQTADINSTFCDHLLSELRALSEPEARALRRTLTVAMWNVQDSKEESLSQPVRFVDAHGRDVGLNNMDELIVFQQEQQNASAFVRPTPLRSIPTVQQIASTIEPIIASSADASISMVQQIAPTVESINVSSVDASISTVQQIASTVEPINVLSADASISDDFDVEIVGVYSARESQEY